MRRLEQDRDNVIAAVEDARAAQERETARLRDKLVGLGMLEAPVPPLVETNGKANGTSNDRCSGLVKKEEVMHVWLVSEAMWVFMRYWMFRLV